MRRSAHEASLVCSSRSSLLTACGAKKEKVARSATTNATTTVDSDGCHAIKTPDPEKRHAPKPTTALDASKTYDVTLETNCGNITIRLDVKDSPKTTASFVSLVRRRYFDGTIFHRIIPGFVIQGGDPTGTGTGGPGYTTVEAPPASTQVHGGRRRDGEDADRAARARPAASSSS